MAGLVPNELYRRILPSCYSIDRVVLASNVDDNSAGALASQVTLRQLEGRPAQNPGGYRTEHYADHEKRNGSNE